MSNQFIAVDNSGKMVCLKLLLIAAVAIGATKADPSAVEVLQDMYSGCLQHFSISCVKPKALFWISQIADKPAIRVTDDLVIVRKSASTETVEQRTYAADVFDKFEDFLQSHDLVAKVPHILSRQGPLGNLLPRSFQPEDLRVPLAATGRSKIVKKVIVPFLLGLKFKTAVLVPLTLALIALKTWKALTLGLLSLVLTGALIIFKFSKPKVAYEVIHYPHAVEHHVEHHPVEHHPPATATGWDNPGYGRQMTAQEMAYNAHLR